MFVVREIYRVYTIQTPIKNFYRLRHSLLVFYPTRIIAKFGLSMPAHGILLTNALMDK